MSGYAFARCRGLIRCLRMYRYLKRRRVVNLEQLAARYRVSTRTIRRDLQALAAAGFEVPHGNDQDMAA